MNLRNTINRAIFHTFLSLSLLVPITLFSYDQKFITHVTDNYLNSFGLAEKKDEQKPKQEEKTLGDRIKDWFKPPRFTAEIKEHTAREKRERAFQASPIQSATSASVIDTVLIDKMELIRGTDTPTAHLMSRVIMPYLHTKNGECATVALLTQPIDGILTLQKRQQTIATFIHNDALRNHCETIFTTMQQAESYLYEFFEPEDPAHEELMKKIYWGKWAPANFNKSAAALEIRTRLSNIGTAATIGAIPLGTCLYTALLNYMVAHSFVRYFPPEVCNAIIAHPNLPLDAEILEACRELGINPDTFKTFITDYAKGPSIFRALKHGLYTTYILAKQVPAMIKGGWKLTGQISYAPLRHGSRLVAGGFGGLYTFSLYKVAMEAKFNKDIANHLQMRLIGVASYLNGMKEIYRLAATDTTLKTSIPSLAYLRELVEPSGKYSAQFNELIALLGTSTFKGKASFFSLTGRVLAAFKLMQDVKQELAAGLRAIGEIEAYYAAAKLIKAHEQAPVHYSIAEFVSDSTPYIHATNFWNPFVSAFKAVPNSIEFKNGQLQSMILTGPNTGGKSTFIKGLMINLLLAHTFGIATADHLTLTPFTKLTSYLNITDNTMAGISGLKAEILRAKELIETLRALPHNKFMFIIIDEIFTATSPEQAEKLAYDFIKQLCAYNNCIFIDATHFSKLTELEKEANSGCKNYHMEALTDAHGNVTKYTYKLKEGISNVKNATQVATEQHIFGA